MGNTQSKDSYKRILDDIFNDCIYLNRSEVKRAKELLVFVLEEKLLPEFRKDELFNDLYRGNYNTGSFFDGLRITNVQEFDINLILDFPFPPEDIHIIKRPGVRILETRYSNKHVFLNGMKIDAANVRNWFKGVLYKALYKIGGQFEKDGRCYQIKNSESGPAMTVRIRGNRLMFDLDLVPVFEKDAEFLVPKSPDHAKNAWRPSNPKLERLLLEGNTKAKRVIKLLKRLRDVQGWHPLASYYIKTVVMHCLDEVGYSNSNLLNQLDRSVRLLINFLDEGKIPFYHEPEYNLLEDFHADTLVNLRYRLQNIRDRVLKDPMTLYKYFNVEYFVKESASVQFQSSASSHLLDVDSDEELEEISYYVPSKWTKAGTRSREVSSSSMMDNLCKIGSFLYKIGSFCVFVVGTIMLIGILNVLTIIAIIPICIDSKLEGSNLCGIKTSVHTSELIEDTFTS